MQSAIFQTDKAKLDIPFCLFINVNIEVIEGQSNLISVFLQWREMGLFFSYN